MRLGQTGLSFGAGSLMVGSVCMHDYRNSGKIDLGQNDQGVRSAAERLFLECLLWRRPVKHFTAQIIVGQRPGECGGWFIAYLWPSHISCKQQRAFGIVAWT